MKAALRLVIVGSTGRMGQEILRLAKADERVRVVAGVARGSTPLADKNCLSLDELDAGQVDVVVDFSLPHLLPGVLQWCSRHGKPLVSGVTGLNAEQKSLIQSAAAKIPVLWAPNMSLGVAVLAQMLSGLAKLEGFEFQIEEVHHKHKKDKPSGTALFLQEKLVEAVGPGVPEPVAIRGGGVFGIHKVWAMGDEEVVTLEHSALNRGVFARGALKAAQWIHGRSPGQYKMMDVLGDGD